MRFSEERYTFSKYRFEELIAYLRQYPEKKKKINDAMLTYRGQSYDRVGHGSGYSDSVLSRILYCEEDPVISRAMEDVEYIEKTAKSYDHGRWYDAMIAHFCHGKTYEQLRAVIVLPTYHKQDFYDAKRAFLERINAKDWYMVKDENVTYS